MKSAKAEVVVITGATAGIGRATARLFAERGAYIALLARDEERLETTRQEVAQLGGKALAIPTDVSDAAQVEAAAEQVERELGPIDIWAKRMDTSSSSDELSDGRSRRKNPNAVLIKQPALP